MNPLGLLKLAPWALSALLALGLLWYRGEYESEVAARAGDRAEAAAAVAAQQAADRDLSAQLLDRQKQRLDTLHAQALSDLKAVSNAPVTKDCGPVMRASSRSVRDIIVGGAGQPATRP